MSRKFLTSKRIAYLALIANAIIWGLALPIVKKGYESGLTPYTFLTSRMLVATITSLPLLYFFRKTKNFTHAFKPKSLLRIVPLEILGTVITLLLLYEGLRLTSAVESTLISMTTPLFVVLGGILFLKEKEERNEWLGLLFAMIGTSLLVINPLLESMNGHGSTLGNLFILGQNVTLAIYYLLAKKTFRPFNKFAVTHISFWVGTVGFFTIGTYLGHSPLLEFSGLISQNNFWPLFAILYMGIPGSILALTFYLIGQDRIEASEAVLFSYLQPLISIPASIILIGESISPLEILATIVIALGVYLAQRR